MTRQFRTWALVACIGAAGAFGAQLAAADMGSPGDKQRPAIGQHEHKHKGHRGDHAAKLAKELGLTERQKSQAKALKESLMAENKELFGTMRAEKRQLRAMIHSGTADEAAIRAQAAKVAAAEAELAVKKAQGARQFLALLTPDQVTKYKALQEKWASKREGRSGRFSHCEEEPMK